ncbi:Ger(x)C family spore germination protein [Peribacillus sp. B-H-3]|uniref:Ger(x)C family spore germination protein n=1 Tax=Peribacillus sp. B-H-3 TaxID=3400420 RepID=UPI003B02E811
MKRSLLIIMAAAVILSGCWDQRLIKESNLIRIVGYDKEKNHKLRESVGYPVVAHGELSAVQPQSNINSTINYSPRDARLAMDRKVVQTYDSSKVKVFLYGDALAKENVYNSLDVIYRDPKGSLNYEELIQSGNELGMYRLDNVQSLCTAIFTEGKDIVLPFIKLRKKEGRADIIGTALFHHKKMTGQLNYEESSMLTLLKKMKKTKSPYFSFIIGKQTSAGERALNARVKKIKGKMNIQYNEIQGAHVKISYKVDMEISQYPPNHLTEKKTVDALSKKMSAKMNDLAYTTIEKLQKANCDALGIGQKLHAFHYDAWSRLTWDKDYPNVKITPDIKVNIIQHGIIN